MSPRPRIAIVEDDDDIRRLIAQTLSDEAFDPVPCKDGEALFVALDAGRIDAILLDIMMPGRDGLTICRELRRQTSLPVIIVSARGEDLDRIIGLEIGADDYVAKPFNPRELTARLRAVLRRARAGDVASGDDAREVYHFSDFILDADARTLTDAAGNYVRLSSGEIALLLAFVRRPRRVLTRDQLLDWTRSPDAAPFDRAIDVQLSRLRARLGDDPHNPVLIRTIRGEGYVFSASVRRGDGS